MNDQISDLRALRLAYAAAITATEEAQVETARVLIHCTVEEQRSALADLRDKREIEHDAGIAFLAALDKHDPACIHCGCTELDACLDEFTGEPCSWVSREPPVCSACSGKKVPS